MSASKPKPPIVYRTPLAIGLCFAATLGLLAADLATKDWASALLSELIKTREPKVPGELATLCRAPMEGGRCRRDPHVVIDGFFELEYAQNTGAAFGIGRDWPKWLRVSVFGLAALAASIGLLWMFIAGRGGPLFAYSVPLVVSGAAGNLVDRARLNYVVDFIHFFVGQYNYPNFNIADITIVVGVGLMLLDGFHKERQKKKSDAAAETEAKAEEQPSRSRGGKKGKKKRKKSGEGASEPAP